MRIGNHCVLFGPRIVGETETILEQYAATGCDGVEIGCRFFGNERRAELQELLEKHGLRLAAFHTNCLMTDLLDKPDETKAYFLQAGRFLEQYPDKNIMFTPLPLPSGSLDLPIDRWDARLRNAKQFIPIARALNEIAEMLGDLGVTFSFHNHNYEFHNSGLIFNGIMEYAPAVRLGLDVGWAQASGWDAIKLVREYGARMRYVHLRDVRMETAEQCTKFSELHDRAFVDIGEGDMDFKTLLPLLQESLGMDGWATVEYETGEADCARYRRANEYIHAVIG